MVASPWKMLDSNLRWLDFPFMLPNKNQMLIFPMPAPQSQKIDTVLCLASECIQFYHVSVSRRNLFLNIDLLFSNSKQEDMQVFAAIGNKSKP